MGSSSGSSHSTGSPSPGGPILSGCGVPSREQQWHLAGSGRAAETLCMAGHQNHPKGSAQTGQPCQDLKSGEVLCLCWECWAAWERTWHCTHSAEPWLNWGQTQLFPRLPCLWHGWAAVLGGHVLESLCQGSGAWQGQGYSWLPAGVWPKQTLGFGGLLVLAGCNFSKGSFQATGLRLKQLPVSVPGSAGGP